MIPHKFRGEAHRALTTRALLEHGGVKYYARGSHVQKKEIGNQASSPEGESATPGLGSSHIDLMSIICQPYAEKYPIDP